MARVYTKKARKQYKCSKCGCKIEPKEEYYSYTLRPSGRGKGLPYKRCLDHYPRQSEMTFSKMSSAYAAQEQVEDAIGDFNEEHGAASSLADAIRSAAESVEEAREGYQESYDNMENAFPSGCPTMEDIQEKIDALEAYHDALEEAADEIEGKDGELSKLLDERDEAQETLDGFQESVAEGEDEANEEYESNLQNALEEAQGEVDSLMDEIRDLAETPSLSV